MRRITKAKRSLKTSQPVNPKCSLKTNSSLKTQQLTIHKSSLKTQMERRQFIAKMMHNGSLKPP